MLVDRYDGRESRTTGKKRSGRSIPDYENRWPADFVAGSPGAATSPGSLETKPTTVGPRSSAGQSSCLLSRRSHVRIVPGAPSCHRIALVEVFRLQQLHTPMPEEGSQLAYTWNARWEDGNDALQTAHDSYVSASQAYEPGDKDSNSMMAQLGQELIDKMNEVDSSAFRDKADFDGYKTELQSAVERFRSNFEKI